MRLSRPAKAALVGILVIVILGVASSIARANPQCGPEADVMAALVTKYGEAPIFSGDTDSTSRIVITVNSDTGTWTVLTLQSGVACFRAAGRSFATMPVKPNI